MTNWLTKKASQDAAGQKMVNLLTQLDVLITENAGSVTEDMFPLLESITLKMKEPFIREEGFKETDDVKSANNQSRNPESELFGKGIE
jgi:hypothetical protein